MELNINYLILGLLSAFSAAGGAITTTFLRGFFQQKTSHQETLQNQINGLEKRLKDVESASLKLQKGLTIWKSNYWSLYRWVVKMANKYDIKEDPPNITNDHD